MFLKSRDEAQLWDGAFDVGGLVSSGRTECMSTGDLLESYESVVPDSSGFLVSTSIHE